MKQIVCEACGSKDLVKQDGIFVCQHCNTKYLAEEEKKNKDDVILNSFTTIFKDAAEEMKKAKEPETHMKKDAFSWVVLFFLSLSLGWLGVDRFYVGKKVSGVIKFLIFFCFFISYMATDRGEWEFFKFLTSLAFVIWWFLDFFRAAKGEYAGFRRKGEQDFQKNDEQEIIIRIRHE